MSSASETAEERFKSAFERLKTNEPRVLPRGTPVSQNNVAKEAGTDPSALRKLRYPALIREIQAWVDINSQHEELQQRRQARRMRARDDLATKLNATEKQRDNAQAQLVSAHRLVLELLQKNAQLESRLNEMLPSPTPLGK